MSEETGERISESPMEQEKRIREDVEQRPIAGGEGSPPEEKPEVDIEALVRARVEAAVGGVKAEVADLRAKLEASKAHTEVLEKEVSTLRGVETLMVPLEKIQTATERTAAKEEAEIERLLIPEDERPKAPEQWVTLIRKELANLRDRGESPYSPYLWGERIEIKRILDSIPMRDWEGISAEEWKEFRETLVREIWVIQKEDGLAVQYKQRSNTIDGLKELVEIAPATGVELDPEKLNYLSKLAVAEVPEYLKGIIPEGESMSVQISRALYLYTKYFGIWAEDIAKELDRPGGIEEKKREEWLKDKFHGDMKRWEEWVGKEIQSTVEQAIQKKKQDLGKEVLERLGFGKNGIVPYSILKGIFKEIPKEVLVEDKYSELKKRIEEAGETGGLSLLELFDKNIFCHNVNAAESRYIRWLVSMLAGSEYAGDSATRFLRYTGESGEMNTTHAPGVWLSDAFTRIPWIERRRLSEARKRRAAGPRITLGRYKFAIEKEGKERGLIHSWIREAEVEVNGEKKKIVELLRSNDIWFHEIPWVRLDWGTYVSDFLLPLSHSVAVFKALTNPNIELVGREGLLSQAGALEALNKSFQYAFNDWEKGRVVLLRRDGKTEIKGEVGWEKRENWARYWLEEVEKPGGLADFGRALWSPWFAFYTGSIYEHQPDRLFPQKEIRSPSGIYRERKIPHSRRWNREKQKAEGGRLYRLNSVADFMGEGVEQEFLTLPEAELLSVVCQLKIKTKDILDRP